MHRIEITRAGRVVVDGQTLGAFLTPKEERVLRAVLGHREVATKEFILDSVYGGRDEPEPKIVDVFVCKVRKKLGLHARVIQTVWGRGWMRHPDYDWITTDADSFNAAVDADLIADVTFVTGETPEHLLNRLLRSERERVTLAA